MNPWILKEARSGQAKIRLFCFPYSGGGASVWRGWHEALAPEIDVISVQLPGRENRLREPAATNFAPYIEALTPIIQSTEPTPFALMGHSMGAHLSFALTTHFAEHRMTLPKHLVISGRRPTHLPAPPKVSMLPDDDLLETVRSRHGAIQLHDELLRMMLPTIRADLHATEHWPAPPPGRLDVPFTVLGGTDDPWVDIPSLDHWFDYAKHIGSPKLFSGDHFFIHQCTDAVQKYVKERLLDSLSPPPPPPRDNA